MINIIQQLITEKNNETVCPVRVATTIAATIYHAAAVAGVYFGSIHIDMAALGQYLTHMVTLIAGGGATVGVKSVLKADAE